jgi:hypothetical protein
VPSYIVIAPIIGAPLASKAANPGKMCEVVAIVCSEIESGTNFANEIEILSTYPRFIYNFPPDSNTGAAVVFEIST